MRPTREPARHNGQTYFVSFQTAGRAFLFRHERWVKLLLDSIAGYADSFALHDFVVMPGHVHLLISPSVPLEKALQLVKGGFSFRAKKELGWTGEVWQRGFSDHRIRDEQDYEQHLRYITHNFASVGASANIGPMRHSSGSYLTVQPIPLRLKPLSDNSQCGAAEAAPLQSKGQIAALQDVERR